MANYNKLKCLFWNARSLRTRKNELPTILSDLDIFICVETWLKDSNDYQIPGFVSYRKDRLHSNGGGILILVKKSVGYVELTDLTTPDILVELVGIKVTNFSPSISIIVCYKTPDCYLNQQQWDTIIENSSKTDYCLMVGEFNAHNNLGNCNKTDSHGEKLLNSIENFNLFVHNSDTYSHIDAKQGKKSNIDLIITSLNLADKLDFSINDDTLGSDHFPVFITINTEKSAEKYEFFTSIITEAISLSTPKQKHFRSNKLDNPVSWWNEDCNKAKRLRKAAYKKWEFDKNSENFIAYKKAVASAIRTFKKSKIDHFKQFAETINFHVNINYVWSKAKILKNKLVKITSNHCTSDPSSMPTCCESEFFDTPFDYREFNVALS